MEEPGYSEVVSVFFQNKMDGDQDIIDDAEFLIGMSIEEAPFPAPGVVSMSFGIYEGYLGRLDSYDKCTKVGESTRDSVILAHEIAHALGAEHSEDPENLMAPAPPVDPEVTINQVKTMRAGAFVLQSCLNGAD